MIINSIHAENVLKYSVLDIDNIPDKGLIAVIGDNESGKSSIGESICFALFGRTFSLGPHELDKVIRWGESRCSIRLDFTVPDGTRYQIARFLDQKGNHGASISVSGGDPMVRGPAEVEEKLRSLIGFNYTEFVESFYLAQREISTPNPHSAAVKAMAGVDAMQRAKQGCITENEGFQQQLREAADEKAGIDAELAELNLDEDQLEELETEQQGLSERIEDAHQRIRGLADRSLQVRQAAEQVLSEAKQWLATEFGQSSHGYRELGQRLAGLIEEIEPACAEDQHCGESFEGLIDFAARADEPVAAFDRLRTRAAEHADALRARLGEQSDGEDEPVAPAPVGGGSDADATEPTLVEQQRQLEQRESELLAEQRQWRSTLRLCLFVGGVLGGGYAFASFIPDGQALFRQLVETTPWLGPALPWLGIAAAVFGVFAASGGWHGSRADARIRDNSRQQAELSARQHTAREHITSLSRLDDAKLADSLALLQRLDEPELVAQAAAFSEGSGQVLLEPEHYRQHQLAFQQRVVALTQGMTRSREHMTAETERLDQSIADGNAQRQALQGDIEVEQERVRKYRELLALAASVERRSADLSHRIRVRELGIDLLYGAIQYISQRFNTEVRNLSAEPLLKFTKGRYEHLQIDQDLNVKAFSNQKRDFMQLDEISSGTQRQIMLAVRMSLSQKLVNSVIQGPQMLYLDEPFAFFDEDRTASSLAVLPEVSPDFTQIWVTSQTFPPQSHFDIFVECNAKESVSPWIRYADGRSPDFDGGEES